MHCVHHHDQTRDYRKIDEKDHKEDLRCRSGTCAYTILGSPHNVFGLALSFFAVFLLLLVLFLMRGARICTNFVVNLILKFFVADLSFSSLRPFFAHLVVRYSQSVNSYSNMRC